MTNDCLHSELTRLSATLWECAERDCMFAIRLPQPATSADREVPGSQVEPREEPFNVENNPMRAQIPRASQAPSCIHRTGCAARNDECHSVGYCLAKCIANFEARCDCGFDNDAAMNDHAPSCALNREGNR